MSHICVDLALYGSVARYRGGRHMSHDVLLLPPSSTFADLFAKVGITPAERGFVFRNAVLYEMPGLNVAGSELLQDGDHVGIFAADRMWPYQYRQGARVSKALAQALKERGDVRHTYRQAAD